MNILGLIALLMGGTFAAYVFVYALIKGRLPRWLRRRRRRRRRPMGRRWAR